MVSIAATPPFKAGDHLKAAHWFAGVIPYAHHGIYEGDGWVIDFGAGVWDRVTRVSLDQFRADSPTVEVVRHGRVTATTGYLFESAEPDEIVARARCLLAQSKFPQRYNVVGLNCEHVANWCAAGGYCESHQTRHVFALKAYFGFLFGIYIALKVRRGIALSTADKLVAILSLVVSVVLRSIYNHNIGQFYKWANPAWDAWASNPESA